MSEPKGRSAAWTVLFAHASAVATPELAAELWKRSEMGAKPP